MVVRDGEPIATTVVAQGMSVRLARPGAFDTPDFEGGDFDTGDTVQFTASDGPLTIAILPAGA
jgi:hypothetical protein